MTATPRLRSQLHDVNGTSLFSNKPTQPNLLQEWALGFMKDCMQKQGMQELSPEVGKALYQSMLEATTSVGHFALLRRSLGRATSILTFHEAAWG